MKAFLAMVLVSFLHVSFSAAQETDRAEPLAEDVTTINGIITAVYETLSGPIGQERPWARNRSLFHPSAHMAHSQWRTGGDSAILMPMTHEEHIDAVSGYTIERGFFEVEIGRHVVEYGTIAHVFSTYSYHTEDETMQGRGINSFQLFFDGTRYWITSVIWSQEAREHPIPSEFINF